MVYSSNSKLVQYDYSVNVVMSSIGLRITNFGQKVFGVGGGPAANGSGVVVVIKDLMILPYMDDSLYYYGYDGVY